MILSQKNTAWSLLLLPKLSSRVELWSGVLEVPKLSKGRTLRNNAPCLTTETLVHIWV
jgi:hypothetical protein